MFFTENATAGEYLDVWLESVIRGSVRYSTYTSYKGYINNHIKRLLGSKILAEIKTADIQGFVGMLTFERRIGARTIGCVISLLKNAFDYAEDYELIIKNPCKRIRLPKVEEEDVKIFDETEQSKIERAVFELGALDSRYYGVLFSLYTGVRIGELCALRWESVDLKNKCVCIKKSINRTDRQDNSGKKTMMQECEPKTKKSKRIIQLPDFLVTLLKKLKANSHSKYVFSMKNDKFIQPRTMQLLHKKLLENAGVNYNNFHVLRHTFASRAGQTSDPRTVSETLGHSNVMITVNRYMHSQKEQKQKMMNVLDKHFKGKKIAAFT